MKFFIAIFAIAFISFTAQSQAQSQNRTEVRTKYKPARPSSNLMNKFGAGISLAPMTSRVALSSRDLSKPGSASISDNTNAVGIEGNYTTFFQGPMGIKAAFLMLKHDIENLSARTTAAKGSMLYTLSSAVYAEGGLNFSKTRINGESSDMGIGFQLGLNFLTGRNILINVSYLYLQSDKTESGDGIKLPLLYNVDLELSGIQAGMTYLF